MLLTQSIAWAAVWYYSSVKAFYVNINIYILLLRKTANVNLFFFIFYSLRAQLNERMKEL